MKRLKMVGPWRDLELLRHSKMRIILFKNQQGSLAPRRGELRGVLAAFAQPGVLARGNDGLPERLSVPPLLTHKYFA